MIQQAHFEPYTIPVVLWLCMFAITRPFPTVLLTLSMHFSSDKDPLTLRNLSTDARIGESAAGLVSSPVAPQENAPSISAPDCQSNPFHWWLRVFYGIGGSVESVLRNQSYRPAFTILGTSMSSLLVHTNGWNLLNSIIVYVYTLSIGKKHFQRYEAAGDLLGGFLGATLTNIILHFRARVFRPADQYLPPRVGLLVERPFFLSLGPALIVVLATLFPFDLFSTYFLSVTSSGSRNPTREVGGADQQGTLLSSVAHVTPRGRNNATNESEEINGQPNNSSFAGLTTPRSRVFVCGGETFSYALSGFRFIYRSDFGQLRGAVWGYWSDWLHNYSTDMQVPWLLPGFARDLLGSDDSGTAASIFRSQFLTSTTSQNLYHMNALAFIMGAGVAWVAKFVPKLFLVRSLIGLFCELPPVRIDIPTALIDSILTDLAVVRVYTPHVYSARRASGDLKADEQNGTSLSFSPSDDNNTPELHRPSLQGYIDIPIPLECFCPITRSIMSDPVTTVDGFTYDREAIEQWLKHRISSPMTNLPLSDTTLTSNREVYTKVKQVVEAYKQATRLRSDS